MTEARVASKQELLKAIEEQWAALNSAIDRLSEQQLTGIRDAHGWSAKDHIIHMTRWERSVVSFLQHRPRHEGLGVEESLYLEDTDDTINTAIYEQTKDTPLDEALAAFRATHQQLMELLAPLSDSDLQKRYREYLPDEPGEGDGPPAVNVIYGNTAEHFAEHLRWMEELVR